MLQYWTGGKTHMSYKFSFKHQASIADSMGITKSRFDSIATEVAMATEGKKFESLTEELEHVVKRSNPKNEMEILLIGFMVGKSREYAALMLAKKAAKIGMKALITSMGDDDDEGEEENNKSN